MPRPPLFTPEETEILHRAAHGVWDYIAYDALVGLAQMTGKSVEAVTMTRSDVIEMVLDAGRLEDGLAYHKAPADLQARWEALDYKTHVRLLTPAFPHRWYGL